MEITSSSLSRLALLFGLARSFTLHAAEIKCPSYHGRAALSSVVVFDGPPEERADLNPDKSTVKGDRGFASWDVRYVFDGGRSLFLVCRFAGLSDAEAVTLKIEKKVGKCVFRTRGKAGPAEAVCR